MPPHTILRRAVMKRFIAGVVVGVLIGSGAEALAAAIVGEDGPISGWTVLVEGEEACSDPVVRVRTREIECE